MYIPWDLGDTQNLLILHCIYFENTYGNIVYKIPYIEKFSRHKIFKDATFQYLQINFRGCSIVSSYY